MKMMTLLQLMFIHKVAYLRGDPMDLQKNSQALCLTKHKGPGQS